MDKEELEEFGFKNNNGILELNLHDCYLQLWIAYDFISIYDGYDTVPLRNVNTIEKVKQLIELLK